MPAETSTNTLVQPGEFDALPKLRPNEPYFALLARDKLAPPLVEEWADRNRRRALSEHDAGTMDKPRLEMELRQSTEAEMVAASMRAYKAGHPAESQADNGATQAGYSGVLPPPDTLARDKLQSARTRCAAALQNAACLLDEVEEAAKACDNQSMMEIVQATYPPPAIVLRRLAEVVAPKRPQL